MTDWRSILSIPPAPPPLEVPLEVPPLPLLTISKKEQKNNFLFLAWMRSSLYFFTRYPYENDPFIIFHFCFSFFSFFILSLLFSIPFVLLLVFDHTQLRPGTHSHSFYSLYFLTAQSSSLKQVWVTLHMLAVGHGQSKIWAMLWSAHDLYSSTSIRHHPNLRTLCIGIQLTLHLYV